MSERDFVMARLAACKVAIASANEAVDDCLAGFVGPEADAKGKLRRRALDAALESLGCATRAAESAEEHIGLVNFTDGEPWV